MKRDTSSIKFLYIKRKYQYATVLRDHVFVKEKEGDNQPLTQMTNAIGCFCVILVRKKTTNTGTGVNDGMIITVW
jgi:hypothetical protein